MTTAGEIGLLEGEKQLVCHFCSICKIWSDYFKICAVDPWYLADPLIWLPAPTDFTVTSFTGWPTDVVMVVLEAAFEDWT